MTAQLADPVSDRVAKLVNKGAEFLHANQVEPARLHFLAALALDPKNPTALQNLGATLRILNHHEAAAIVSRRSVVLTGGMNPHCLSNLGVSQMSLRQYGEAMKTLKTVVEELPDEAAAWHNYGLAMYMTGQLKRALECFDTSMSLGYNAQCASDRSLTLLSLGRIEEGLAAYECRWEVIARNAIWTMNIPEWQGSSLDGQHLLLHHEQGFGDSLMLIRFVKELAQQQPRARVTVAVPAPLMTLFAINFPFLRVVDLEDEEKLSEGQFDYHCPLLSLMRWVGIKEPKNISSEHYLGAPPTDIILPDAKLKVGICWASGNHHPVMRDRRRVVPVTAFLPLLESLDVALVSLQIGNDVKDLVNNGLEGLIFDPSYKISNFYDTARVIASLDVVVTVDSAVAHLAGAMGKPCAVLSPFTRCWRWWGGATGWPWYNKMQIFPQEASGSWHEPMRQVTRKILWGVKDMR